MYPLTIGLAIENRELRDQTQGCLSALPFRVIVEHQDLNGDLVNFLDRLERMRPDVVLIDISSWKEPLEGLVSSIRNATGDPMIIALHNSASAETILAALRAGVHEFLFPPLQESLRRALEKRSVERRRRDGGTKGAGKGYAFLSAKGGCGATTLVCHVAAELGYQNHKVLLMDLDLDAGMVRFLTKTKSVYSILDAINNLHRLDISYWRALVSNGIPGVEIVSTPAALATKTQLRDDQVRHVLGFALPIYDWTLVDLGRSLSRTALAALEELDEACVVTTLEVPALHQTKQIIQTLFDSGYGKNRIKLILNRAPKRLDITPGELEKMLGVPIYYMVPNDYPELYETYAEGRMLSRSSELGKSIAKLASRLSGLEEVSRKRFTLFK
jgi:pilus assembly protein CpaE